jgi:hypothetical protein
MIFVAKDGLQAQQVVVRQLLESVHLQQLRQRKNVELNEQEGTPRVRTRCRVSGFFEFALPS